MKSSGEKLESRHYSFFRTRRQVNFVPSQNDNFLFLCFQIHYWFNNNFQYL